MAFKESRTLVITGGRDHQNKHQYIDRVLDSWRAEYRIKAIVHGGAKGADFHAGKWARANAVQEVICPANWEAWGRRAGPARNRSMLGLFGEGVQVLAFSGGRGTENCKAEARRMLLPVAEYLGDI